MKIDWRLTEKMMKEFATNSDIAAYFGTTVAALNKQAEKDLGTTLDDYGRRCRSVGIARLRSAAFESAIEDKNPQILKLMLVNYAGMVDRMEQKVSLDIAPVLFVDKLPELEADCPIEIEAKEHIDNDDTKDGNS